MKNFILVALAALVVFGCGNTASTPEDVAKEFATALDKGDFKAAKSLSTEASHSLIGMMEGLMSGGGEMAEKAKAEMGKAKFEKATCEGTDAKKTCKICCDDKGKDTEFELVKENGTWKVNMTKESMGGGGSSEMEEPATEPVDTLEVVTEPAHGSGH